MKNNVSLVILVEKGTAKQVVPRLFLPEALKKISAHILCKLEFLKKLIQDFSF